MQVHQPVQPSPAAGQRAPRLSGESTLGSIRPAELAGHWLVLISFPAGDAHACAGELVSFAARRAELNALNCRVVALSSGTVDAHKAWCARLQAQHEIPIDIPVIADRDGSIARAFGMVHAASGEPSLRHSLYLIDPQGVIRALMYDMCDGSRSVSEVLHRLRSLAVSDAMDKVAVRNWETAPHGDDAMHDATSRTIIEHPEFGCVEWYDYARPEPAVHRSRIDAA